MNIRPPIIRSAMVVCLAAMAMCGCSSDDPTGSDPGPIVIPYIWPGDSEQLMANFHRAYSELNITEYEKILHEDFKFIFINAVDTWYRQQDIQSTLNMFAGNPGVNPDDSYRDPVQSIAINTLIRQTPWEDVPANDPDFPNSERALFQVQIVFTLEGGENTITVQSDHFFFIKSEEVDSGGGTTRSRYFLYGQRDLLGSGGKGNEDQTWGSVKRLYYPEN
ncbi:hypothetical protein H8E07_16670 [bacterium]|nr:hypothetical protein [bacterium]